MSNTGPVLPWGAPKQDATAKKPEGIDNSVDMNSGQRVRVRLELLLRWTVSSK